VRPLDSAGVTPVSVRHEEVVDDADAVRVLNGAQSAKSAEHDGSNELRESQDRLEFVQFSSGFGTLEYLIERVAKVVEHTGPQRGNRTPCFIGTFGRRIEGAQREPRHHGQMNVGVFEQSGLTTQRLDQSFTQRSSRRGWSHRREQSFEGRGQKFSGATKMAIESGARYLRRLGNRLDGHGLDAAHTQQVCRCGK
jgi:hypothetical protein